MTEVFETAKKYGKVLEINAYPQRLDLSDINSRAASQQGILIEVGTDAHSVNELEYMDLGVSVARRGWLEKKDILNTLPLKDLLKKLRIK